MRRWKAQKLVNDIAISLDSGGGVGGVGICIGQQQQLLYLSRRRSFMTRFHASWRAGPAQMAAQHCSKSTLQRFVAPKLGGARPELD